MKFFPSLWAYERGYPNDPDQLNGLITDPDPGKNEMAVD